MSYTLLVVTLVASIIDWIAVARKIHNLEYNVLQHRPTLNLSDKLGLLFRSFFM